MSRSKRGGGVVGTIAGLAAWTALVVIFVCVWQFHADNIALCDRLGGSYEAFGGNGQCIKGQVILFDPRHDYEGATP